MISLFNSAKFEATILDKETFMPVTPLALTFNQTIMDRIVRFAGQNEANQNEVVVRFGQELLELCKKEVERKEHEMLVHYGKSRSRA